MRFSTVAIAAVAATANAADPSICDKYTTALLKDNTAKNQATLLTLLVNTVVIGNYTMPNKNAVPGILAKGKVGDEDVNLLPYFSGGLASSNKGGKAAVMNFLDGGAAEPLKKNMPANDKTSNQYFLLTHLYEFFGTLLGCSMQGKTGFAAYGGETSMYTVHKFMALNNAQVTYFIQQVGLAATSFGVSEADVGTVAKALMGAFGDKCAAPIDLYMNGDKMLQAICTADDCPEAKDADCGAYAKVAMPAKASGMASGTATMPASTGTASMPAASGTQSAAASGTATPSSVPDNAGATAGFSIAAVVAGVAAFFL